MRVIRNLNSPAAPISEKESKRHHTFILEKLGRRRAVIPSLDSPLETNEGAISRHRCHSLTGPHPSSLWGSGTPPIKGRKGSSAS